MKFHFTAHKWGNEESYYSWDTAHKYPRFEEVATKKFVTEADNLNAACLKFVTAFPQWSIGFNCISDDRKSFYMGAVKDYWYSQLNNPTDAEIIAEIQRDFEKRGN